MNSVNQFSDMEISETKAAGSSNGDIDAEIAELSAREISMDAKIDKVNHIQIILLKFNEFRILN